METTQQIHAQVASGLPIPEAVPAAVGIFVAAGGDPMEAIAGGGNIGDDTHTVAIIAGSMAGALRGLAAGAQDPSEHLQRPQALHLTAGAPGPSAVAPPRADGPGGT